MDEKISYEELVAGFSLCDRAILWLWKSWPFSLVLQRKEAIDRRIGDWIFGCDYFTNEKCCEATHQLDCQSE